MDKRSMDYDVYCGIDVGKAAVHIVAIESATGEVLFDREAIYEEGALKEIFKPLAKKGKVLVVVDQCAGFGSMIVALAKDMVFDVAHISPRRFSDIAHCFCEDKTDRIDARIICEVAMNIPRFIEPVFERKEVLLKARALLAHREDVSKERVAALNRLHAYLQQISPPLAAIFRGNTWTLGDSLPLQVIVKFGGPSKLCRTGHVRARKWASTIKYYPEKGPLLIDCMFEAIANQSVYAAESEAIESIVRKTAERIQSVTAEKAALDKLIENMLVSCGMLDSLRRLPGIGAHYGAVILSEIGDISRFPSEAHLASYSSVAPAKKESGLKKGKKKRKGGNKRLKNCFINAARAAVLRGDVASVAYYKKKRAEGKGKLAAHLALARRRVPLIYEILKGDALNIAVY